jgi:hypothetical protein
VSDLAEIPEKYGVSNVYGDLDRLFAFSTVAQPSLAPALMGTLLKGLGPERAIWGTDALWTGSPQWQIEGLRRLEIPKDMQKKFGFKPMGAADGRVKQAIFSGNAARKARRSRQGPRCRDQSRLSAQRRRPQQSALRIREEAGVDLSAGENIDHTGREYAEAQSWCARCTILLSSEPDTAAKRMGMWR